MRLAILHGPNLNRLGKGTTLADITRDVDTTAARLDVTAAHFQSNFEGALTGWIHAHQHEVDGYVVNPAGLASYGYPLLDALRDTERPFAVVYLSPLDSRERTDIFAGSATVYLAGAGWRGYSLAVDALVHHLRA
jgi:3-dehydroquinate dehydratase II